MALIRCPECQKEISDKAYACPHCGNPMKDFPTQESQKSSDRFWKSMVITTLVFYVLVAILGVLGFFTVKKAMSDVDLSQLNGIEGLLQNMGGMGGIGSNPEKIDDALKQLMDEQGLGDAMQMLLH